jgi:hypothetical protein
LKKTSEKGKPGENRGRKANGSTVIKMTMIARLSKIVCRIMISRQAWKLSRPVVFLKNQYLSILSFDKGKPGESRGRKANGSKVTCVTMVARLPKTT